MPRAAYHASRAVEEAEQVWEAAKNLYAEEQEPSGCFL